MVISPKEDEARLIRESLPSEYQDIDTREFPRRAFRIR
jgi:hypothetical protein